MHHCRLAWSSNNYIVRIILLSLFNMHVVSSIPEKKRVPRVENKNQGSKPSSTPPCLKKCVVFHLWDRLSRKMWAINKLITIKHQQSHLPNYLIMSCRSSIYRHADLIRYLPSVLYCWARPFLNIDRSRPSVHSRCAPEDIDAKPTARGTINRYT